MIDPMTNPKTNPMTHKGPQDKPQEWPCYDQQHGWPHEQPFIKTKSLLLLSWTKGGLNIVTLGQFCNIIYFPCYVNNDGNCTIFSDIDPAAWTWKSTIKQQWQNPRANLTCLTNTKSATRVSYIWWHLVIILYYIWWLLYYIWWLHMTRRLDNYWVALNILLQSPLFSYLLQNRQNIHPPSAMVSISIVS